jgi:hypothetical protein
LLEGCRRRLGDRLRGHDETIGERQARDLAAFHDLPSAPYDACEKKAVWISSLSLVRDRGTDYSVPTAYSHREILIRGYVDEVMISLGGGGDCPRSVFLRARELRFRPAAFPGVAPTEGRALDQGRRWSVGDLPEEFAMLRRLIEARMGKRGKREFVQILRLLEVFRAEDVLASVREASPAARSALTRSSNWCVPDRAPTTPARYESLSLPAKGKGSDVGSRAPSDRGRRRDQPGVRPEAEKPEYEKKKAAYDAKIGTARPAAQAARRDPAAGSANQPHRPRFAADAQVEGA